MVSKEAALTVAGPPARGGAPWRFFALTALISWSCFALAALTGVDVFTDLEVGVILVLGGFGPFIAAIILVHTRGDRAFASDFWRRLVDPRLIKPLWLIVALAIYPAAVLAAFLLTGAELNAGPLAELGAQPALLVVTVTFVLIFGPVSEEPGWRGYALDALQARHGALLASLVLGAAWGLWHVPLLWVEGAFLNATATDAVVLAGYLATVLLYAILFTWVYNNSGRSVLLMIIMHASINMTNRLLVIPPEVYAATAGVLIVICALVIAVYGPRRLVRGPPPEDPGGRSGPGADHADPSAPDGGGSADARTGEERRSATSDWRLSRLEIRAPAAVDADPVARVELQHVRRGRISDLASAPGALHAAFAAVSQIVGVPGRVVDIDMSYLAADAHSAAPGRRSADVRIALTVDVGDKVLAGRARGHDVIPACVSAYVDALNTATAMRPGRDARSHRTGLT